MTSRTNRPELGAASSGSEPTLEQARLLLEQIPGGVLLLDATGRVVYLNGIAELRLEVQRADAFDRDLFRELLPQLERDGVGRRYREGMEDGQVAMAAEAKIDSERGSGELSVGIRSVWLAGERWGLALVEDRSVLATERTRRRRAERLAAIGELATGVAHEINNPLATIRGFAQLLSRDTENEEQAQAVGIIETECGRIARTVQNLQEFVERQEGSNEGPVDLSALVDEVLALKRYALETSGIVLEADLVEAPSPIRGDADAVQRVVLALVCQAEESLNQAEGDRRLAVRTRESTDGVTLYVVDNGPGVSREQLPRLLSPELGRSDLPLGLDVAAALVREQGGQIWADSAEGRGTAYFVRFPRLGEPAPGGRLEAQTADSGPRPLRVLVADDEASLRMAISLFLGREGHRVVEAADAHEALRLAREQAFDVALVDLRMPGDGLALLEALDEIPTFARRTVLMTGDATHPRVRARLAAGQPALLKPFDMTEVVQLVEDLGRAGGRR